MKSKRNASSANAGTQDQNERKKFSFDYTLEGHTFAASCVAFSMFGVKGKYIISGGNDRLVKVWDWSRYLDATQTSSNSDLLHLSISLSMKVEEREIVETCYRKGLVRVLIATSTLDAGVNLPPRRVMFRQPWIGRDFIDGTRYRQMAGRASRTGIDTKGESVLLCKPEDVKRIMGILNDSCPPLHSCLSEDKNGMTHAILEVVASGIVQTANDIHRYVRCTLLNSTKPFEDVAKSAQDSLRWLCHRKFIEWSEDTKLYSTTPLGRASFGSSLCPEESLSVGKQVGVLEPFLMRMAHGAPLHTSNRSRDNAKGLLGRSDCRVGMANQSMLSDEQTLRVCKRFYVAIILSRLVQEVLVAEVCEAFKVARGMVQASQENAGRFASMVSVFCERLGWHDLEGLVSKFQNRVSFGVRVEIVELTAIPYVKGSRARQLYKAGLRTPQAIAVASISEIVKALFESSSWVAQDSAQRRIQLVHAKLFLIKLKRQGLLPSQLSNLLDLMFPSYLNLY
ncbi:helicase and polymerase-containing protein TEBICHI-like isoform X5 [Camellia sinensis]|uniref:helicase and polymerase-containing protein TEBICHI-like isoform X5 n=1 Tax=Camellia sinensis TaxID=4442 RepID=UPI00103652CC|nr:helicase and polymerase-containing protein TEBICHI-like isoform X5 [Camellia sinensis]